MRNVDNVDMSWFHLQFNYTTICHQSSKEFNRDVIPLLQQLIAGEQPAEGRQLNHLLFGSRNDVRDLLQIERRFRRRRGCQPNARIHHVVFVLQ